MVQWVPIHHLAEIHCYLSSLKSWHNNLFLSGVSFSHSITEEIHITESSLMCLGFFQCCPWKLKNFSLTAMFSQKTQNLRSILDICLRIPLSYYLYTPSGEIRKSTFYIRFLFTDHTVFEAPSLMPFLRIAFHPMPTKNMCVLCPILLQIQI